MIAAAVQEDLRFVFEPPKSARMNHAVAVPLKIGSPFRRILFVLAAPGLATQLGKGSQDEPLTLLKFQACAGHAERCQFAARSSCTEIPRNSKRRRIASSIRLFGQEAPAVMPTVICPDGSHSCVSTSWCRCWL